MSNRFPLSPRPQHQSGGRRAQPDVHLVCLALALAVLALAARIVSFL
jgi:hypothetical protein